MEKDIEQRKEEARALFQALSEDFGNADASAGLLGFMDDPEWEVRKIVAEAMAHVSPEMICRFAPLAKDTNAWVRRAAEDAFRQNGVVLDRMRRKESAERADADELNAFRAKYGVKAMQSVENAYRRLCRRQIAGVGHDLRNLLTPLLDNTDGTLELLDSPEAPEAAETMRRLQQKNRDIIKLAVKMADDIRDLTMEVNGRDRMTVRLSDIIREAWGCVSACLGGRGLDMGKIRLECNFPQDLCVFVVKERIIRVFSNLLKNAAESFLVSRKAFRAAGGIVRVTGEAQPGGVRVTVADDGRGIGKDELEAIRLFQPTGMSSKPGGTGYGMSIAYAIVHGHGGSMEMDSEPKKGTSVTVFLPDEEAADESACD